MTAKSGILFSALAFALAVGGCNDDDDESDSTVIVNPPAPDPDPIRPIRSPSPSRTLIPILKWGGRG
jgi:hypothetical protein